MNVARVTNRVLEHEDGHNGYDRVVPRPRSDQTHACSCEYLDVTDYAFLVQKEKRKKYLHNFSYKIQW